MQLISGLRANSRNAPERLSMVGFGCKKYLRPVIANVRRLLPKSFLFSSAFRLHPCFQALLENKVCIQLLIDGG